MIIAGIVRVAAGGLPRVAPAAGTVGIGSHSQLIALGAVYIMARAFANGGSSLTGIEAVSNAVSALRRRRAATPGRSSPRRARSWRS